jgi:hypothetical protein
MGLKTHDDLPTEPAGISITSPQMVGWDVVGRGGYMFYDLMIKHGMDKFDGYNRQPPNFEEVEPERLFSNVDYTHYPIIAIAYRQMRCDYDGTMLGYTLEGRLLLNSLGNGHMIYWDARQKKIRYFMFHFCKHDNETVEQEKGYTRVKCRKCGFVREFDSTD